MVSVSLFVGRCLGRRLCLSGGGSCGGERCRGWHALQGVSCPAAVFQHHKAWRAQQLQAVCHGCLLGGGGASCAKGSMMAFECRACQSAQCILYVGAVQLMRCKWGRQTYFSGLFLYTTTTSLWACAVPALAPPGTETPTKHAGWARGSAPTPSIAVCLRAGAEAGAGCPALQFMLI